MREINIISSLETKQPLFKKFCELNNLTDGDAYSPADFILWTDTLSITAQLFIIREYDPGFKISGCSL